jgi:hypothetical protein
LRLTRRRVLMLVDGVLRLPQLQLLQLLMHGALRLRRRQLQDGKLSILTLD